MKRDRRYDRERSAAAVENDRVRVRRSLQPERRLDGEIDAGDARIVVTRVAVPQALPRRRVATEVLLARRERRDRTIRRVRAVDVAVRAAAAHARTRSREAAAADATPVGGRVD